MRTNSNLHGICAFEWKEQIFLFDNSCPNLSGWAVPLPGEGVWMGLKALISGRDFCWKKCLFIEECCICRGK